MIDLRREGALWVVTLNRPDKRNALTKAMLSDLCAIVAEANESASVLVLTGAGQVFSAGADLDEARAGLATDPVWEELSGGISRLPCLTVAALNGTCAGGALGMVLACDLRIAVPATTVFYPVMKLGFLPQPSDPARLAALVGPSTARLVLLGGQRIGAERALATGLLDEIVEPDALMGRAAMLAADALAGSRDHLARIKALLR